ncbi:MAG: hypothetical protein J7503_03795 [Cellulomonas iranensis]|uniref:hypothetical protein n=1 Tax=Cellulomonas iranensis TaxID=76862 RepID=UPI0013D2DB79|nr:hypothetical protein [Cellulomonas iranensis]MBO9567928.1 hypothetical protein [Cellulomonas iranensis]UCN14205.1 hypothetical protein LFM56_15155 [Cellulomonas iranensis]
MTVPSTDDGRTAAPAPGSTVPALGPRGLPQRVPGLPVRQRDRVSLETLRATFAGLQQVDELARPTVALEPPTDLPPVWPPVTGALPRVGG